MRTLRWFIFVTIMVIPLTMTTASALTCTRLSSAMVSCSDGTQITDWTSNSREITGPGAERGIDRYPIPPKSRYEEPQGAPQHPDWRQPQKSPMLSPFWRPREAR